MATAPITTSLLKFSLKTNLVKSVISEIVSNISHYYYVFGRAQAWPDELSPSAVSESYEYEIEARNDMLLYKQIDSNDIAAVVPRINWVGGYTFDMFDEYSSTYPAFSGATSLENAEFYCLTDDYNVYKCLYNNNNSPSSDRPIGTSTDNIVSGDGYMWKYMYTIPLSVRNKFLTATTMPVSVALSNQFYSKGSIVAYNIDNPGAKYPITSYKVTGFRIIDGGSGYNTAPTVTLAAPDQTGGVQATINSVTMEGNRITNVIMNAQGQGYSNPPIVTITGGDPQHQAVLEPIVERLDTAYTRLKVTGDGRLEENPYQVSRIDVVNGGSGYSSAYFLFTNPDLANGVIASASAIIGDVVLTGTLDASTTSATVTGVGTSFLTSLVINSAIKINDVVYKVLTVASDTVITINTPISITTGTLLYKTGVVKSVALGNRVTATAFVPGNTYTIISTGTTNFTLIGATASTPGTVFTATGVGVGTGVAALNTTATGYGYSKPFYSITQDANASNIVLLTATSISGQAGSGLSYNVITQKNEAEIIPIINPDGSGAIESIKITKPGIGYTYALVTVETSIVKANTTGFVEASILLSFGIGDIESNQSTIELTAVDGAIPVIKILNSGNSYTSTPTVTVTGDGVGCTATAVLNASGSIAKITVDQPGVNYTKATVTISGGGVADGSTNQATAHAIISPKGGHGRDAVSELYAKTVVLHGNLSKEKNQGFTSTNQYRQICIIKNPKSYGKNSNHRAAIASACILVTGGKSQVGISLITQDDVLTYTDTTVTPNRTYTFRVIEKTIDYSTTESALLLSYVDNFIPPNGATLIRYSGTPAAFGITSVSYPDINKYSGELLTIDNRIAFAPSAEQTVVALNSITF